MLGWGRGPLLLVGSGWVFALRDGLLNRIVVSLGEVAKAVPGTKQKPRKISAAPMTPEERSASESAPCATLSGCCR